MKTIGIFKTSCPSGWTRLSDWDNKFLMGSASYGAGGGSDQDVHSIPISAVTGNSIGGFTVLYFENHPRGHKVNHTHTITFNGVNTSTETVLPPYRDVVFCYKET